MVFVIRAFSLVVCRQGIQPPSLFLVSLVVRRSQRLFHGRFDFNRRKEKADMYSSYVKACEAGEIVYPMIKPLYRAHKHLTVDQLYHDKHTPDEIVAAALERKARMDLAWEVLILGF